MSIGKSVSLALLALWASLVFAEEKGEDSSWKEYWVNQQVKLDLSEPSHLLESAKNEFEEINARLSSADRAKAIKKAQTSELGKQLIDNPQWLHGLDVVNPRHPRIQSLLDDDVPSKIWIAGWDGLILFSQDDGIHWNVQVSNTNSNLMAVDFVDQEYGWIVGYDGLILHTKNGGSDWSNQYNAGSSVLRTIDCFDRKRCWVGGAYGYILRTNDGGETWEKSASIKHSDIRSIHMIDEMEGVAAVATGQILRTDDGGSDWTVVHKPGFWNLLSIPGLRAVHSADGVVVWAVGTNHTILKSIDGGNDWISQTDNVHLPKDFNKEDARLHSVVAFDDRNAIAAGLNGLILATTDGGGNWYPQTAAPDSAFTMYAIGFRNDRVGWAAGNYGHVLATNSAGLDWFPVRGLAPDILRHALNNFVETE